MAKQSKLYALTKTVTASYYILIFSTGNKYQMRKVVAYNLEEAINKAQKEDTTLAGATLWWWVTDSLDNIQEMFKPYSV